MSEVSPLDRSGSRVALKAMCFESGDQLNRADAELRTGGQRFRLGFFLSRH